MRISRKQTCKCYPSSSSVSVLIARLVARLAYAPTLATSVCSRLLIVARMLLLCRLANKLKASVKKSVEALKEWHLSPHAPTMAYDAALINAERLIKRETICPWLPQDAGAQGLNVTNNTGSAEYRIMREADLKQQEARATEELKFIRAELHDMLM